MTKESDIQVKFSLQDGEAIQEFLKALKSKITFYNFIFSFKKWRNEKKPLSEQIIMREFP